MNDGNNNTGDAISHFKLITPKELAEWLRVPQSWIDERTRTSGPERLPFYEIGGCRRFAISEIEDYLRVRSN